MSRDTRKLELTTLNGSGVEILLISEQGSLNAWTIDITGRRHLFLCPTELWQSGAHLIIRSSQFAQEQLEPVRVCAYPTTEQKLTCKSKHTSPLRESDFSVFTLPPLPTVTNTTQSIGEIPAVDERYPFRSASVTPKTSLIRLGNTADLVGNGNFAETGDVMVSF